VVERACDRYFKKKPYFITYKSDLGIDIKYDDPREVGADRVVNAIGAISKYGCPAIIIDFGTATTFDVVDESGSYIGGVICPGIGISSSALFEKAAKLPRVDLVQPERVIGANTVDSIQAGLYYGYLEQITGLIKRINGEMGRNCTVITTGGLARVFAGGLGEDVIQDQTLTLEGMRIIYERNR
jgi:type III pantothenate kinase